MHIFPAIAAAFPYNRSILEDSRSGAEGKELTFYFTQAVSNVVDAQTDTQLTYPENHPLFLIRGDVKVVRTSLLIKKANETIYIKANKVLKLPVKGLDPIVAAMEDLLLSVSKNKSGEYCFEGINEPAPYANLNLLSSGNLPIVSKSFLILRLILVETSCHLDS